MKTIFDTKSCGTESITPETESAISEQKQKYMNIFEADMRSQGLSEKMIRKHLSNVDVYINYYLPQYEDKTMSQGCESFGMYVSGFYIRKDTSATPYNMRVMCASIKKFYQCMMNHGFIEEGQLRQLKYTIKDGMDLWLEELDEFDQGGSAG